VEHDRVESDNEEKEVSRHKEARQTPFPRYTDLVPELMEHDRVEAHNEEKGKQVTGHKEADLKHEIGRYCSSTGNPPHFRNSRNVSPKRLQI
jgi:hypothetical protein